MLPLRFLGDCYELVNGLIGCKEGGILLEAVMSKKTRQRLVVLGNGMVGYKFCEALVALGGCDAYEVVVLGEEPRPAYDRVNLTQFFSGKTADDLLMASADWYAENGIQLRLGERAEKIDRKEKVVISQTGEKFAYHKLVLATGSYPFVPPVEGIEQEGVFVYRTIEDLEAIRDYAKGAKAAAVIGGGLLGLEAAKAVVDLGVKTSVVEFSSRLMPRQIDDVGSGILVEQIESLGVDVLLEKATTLVKGNGKVTGMAFQDETELDVDMIVVSAGIRPRDELAKAVGLNVHERGGVVIDDRLMTSDPSIYAIGEVALHRGMIYGLVAPGYDMAQILAQNLMGERAVFEGADMSTKLKLMGVDVANFGDAFGESEACRSVVYQNGVGGVYKRLNISQDGKRLLGGMLVGDASEYGMLLQMVKNEMVLPPEPEALILGDRGGSGGGLAVSDLPDDAQICSCNNVSKGDIVAAVQNGCTQLGDLKTCTSAGTGCGGCMPMVTDILKATLESEGIETNDYLCEHFDYSRQELFEIVKINQIKTFDDLVMQYGQGHGCEVCKPAVASILASLWNDMILEHDVLQDTNDRFLANIQRGGTYSIVPRVPGGEITPEKLIVLGEVAQKYDLYCKITGGQRIDLLGARVEQLPEIWEILVAAGFESGHAYGKAMRTVKSCVGTTWCRYGVQDSTSFAIRIEERYRGIRSPHKIKAACSGCVRECAEAQNKDFGLVATEKGWNLYVGGNGGAKPQHGILLAGDLDEETCITYIDRYLMYYIHTADKLMRTATWLNNLEGGIDYLRKVIIDDHLGICDQLEEDMARLVDTYHCEWKAVVESPELRKRFKHFVNSDEGDETLKWETERGQKRPANWELPVLNGNHKTEGMVA